MLASRDDLAKPSRPAIKEGDNKHNMNTRFHSKRENTMPLTNLDPATLDAPEDVDDVETIEAAQLANEATAVGKVVEDEATPHTEKEEKGCDTDQSRYRAGATIGNGKGDDSRSLCMPGAVFSGGSENVVDTDKPIPMVYSWDEFLERFPDEPIDFALIDPCSIPEDVLDDFRAWIDPIWRSVAVQHSSDPSN